MAAPPPYQLSLEERMHEAQNYSREVVQQLKLAFPYDDNAISAKMKPLILGLNRAIDRYHQPCIALIGRRGAGKTTLINRVIGRPNLLPVDADDTATAVLTEIVAWPDQNITSLQATIYFLTQEEWEVRVGKAKSDADRIRDRLAAGEPRPNNVSKRFQEEYEDLNSLLGSLRAIWGNHVFGAFDEANRTYVFESETNLLNLIHPGLRDDFANGYKSLHYLASDEAAFRNALLQFTSADMALDTVAWPLVSKVTLYGPFPNLYRAQCSLMDVPGSGDENAILRKRHEQALEAADTIFYMPERRQKASVEVARHINSLSEKYSADIKIIINYCKGYGGEDALRSAERAGEFWREKMLRHSLTPPQRTYFGELPVFFLENGSLESDRIAYEAHFQDFLNRGLALPGRRNLDRALDNFIEDFNRSTYLISRLMSGNTVNFGNIQRDLVPNITDEELAQAPVQLNLVTPSIPLIQYFSQLRATLNVTAPNRDRNMRNRICAPVIDAFSGSQRICFIYRHIQEVLQHDSNQYLGFLASLNLPDPQLFHQVFTVNCLASFERFLGRWKEVLEIRLLQTFATQWQGFFRFGSGAVRIMNEDLGNWAISEKVQIKNIAEKVLRECAKEAINQQRGIWRTEMATISRVLSERPLAIAQNLVQAVLPLLTPLVRTEIEFGNFYLTGNTNLMIYRGANNPILAHVAPPSYQRMRDTPEDDDTLDSAWELLKRMVALKPDVMHLPDRRERHVLEDRRAGSVNDVGSVYILSNASYPVDMHKIGYTRSDAIERSTELSTTGVPTPFTVVQQYFTEYPAYVELFLHIVLKNVRVNLRREFFSAPLLIIREAADIILKISAQQSRQSTNALPTS